MIIQSIAFIFSLPPILLAPSSVIIIMQFDILHIIRARDSLDVPNLQGTINHERTTHGGRTEHVLALLIIHHPLLLNCLCTSHRLSIPQPSSAVFIEWGAGDATLGILGSSYFPRPVWTYLVEKYQPLCCYRTVNRSRRHPTFHSFTHHRCE